jgi:hypothetical protein
MDSLFSILGRKDFDEPSEVQSIKKYVKDHFKTNVSVTVREKDILIGVPSASLANTLRFRAPEIKRRCQLDKKLVFRIT